jgi:AGZA family xanthine/uracil permease-like MFS transporter
MSELKEHKVEYALFSKEDLSGFWALFADNLANMVLAAALCTSVIKIPPDIVFSRILPGLGMALIAGLGFYTYLAHRLARREGRTDVTALPYGISTPVLFVYLFGVMLPVKVATGDPLTAWQVGVAAAFIGGIIEASGSLIGPWLKKLTPRAGMLGTLAGIAIVWIGTIPMAEILEHPHIGLPCLAIIIVGLVANQRLPFGVPAGLAAIAIGTAIGLASGEATLTVSGVGINPPIPVVGDLWQGLRYIFGHPKILLIVAPLEIYNFIETMNNVESAEAAGDSYNVGVCQLADGGGTLLGALFGSAFPTTVYIGHPAYKRLGARSGYALGVGVIFFAAALFGLVSTLHELVPVAAVAPLLIFVSLTIAAQAFSACKPAHMPAVAIALLPHVGDIIYKKVTTAANTAAAYVSDVEAHLPESVTARLSDLGSQELETADKLRAMLLESGGLHIAGQAILSRGAIITGLIWGAIAALCIDRKYLRAAGFTIAGGLLTVFGFIHTRGTAELHFNELSLGYAAMAGVFLAVRFASTRSEKKE